MIQSNNPVIQKAFEHDKLVLQLIKERTSLRQKIMDDQKAAKELSKKLIDACTSAAEFCNTHEPIFNFENILDAVPGETALGSDDVNYVRAALSFVVCSQMNKEADIGQSK